MKNVSLESATVQTAGSNGRPVKTDRKSDLTDLYQRVRGFSNRIAEALQPEDCVIQSMPDVSPTRWHLAHVTWFFETFLLSPHPDYKPFDPQFAVLFNSYYNSVGEQFPRGQRGLLSRPTVKEVLAYREAIDHAMLALLESEAAWDPRTLDILELGLNHEQQHQELMLTDIKHVFSINPLYPQLISALPVSAENPAERTWVEFEEGLYEIGHCGDGFAYDNESPRHRVFLEAFALKSHPVTCGDYLKFMEDGGYQRPEFWLSLGWQAVQEQSWDKPLYWSKQDDQWHHFTLGGLLPIDQSLPVCHLSYFEADAYARWADARLPTEAEWEVASADLPITGNFANPLWDAGAAIHPAGKPAEDQQPLMQMFGDVWEWTSSSYAAYPGYHPPEGALGEYNGKFMCNQYVLRGGSCATPAGHIRRTYRNFFPPEARWQFSGLRLASDRA